MIHMKHNLHRNAPSSLQRWLLWGVLVSVFIGVLAGCAASRSVENEIAVVGEVTARGQVPFVVQVLETDDQNAYVLVMDESLRARYVNPARLRVTGVVYVAAWNGRPFTHLRVTRLEPAGD
jgi:hypothetical protein